MNHVDQHFVLWVMKIKDALGCPEIKFQLYIPYYSLKGLTLGSKNFNALLTNKNVRIPSETYFPSPPPPTRTQLPERNGS